MHPSIHAAVPAVSPYHDVFQYQNDPMVTVLALLPYLAASAIVIVPVIYYLMDRIKGKPYSFIKTVGATGIGVCLAVVLVGGVSMDIARNQTYSQDDVEKAMAQNVKTQYHAVLKIEKQTQFFGPDDFLTRLDQPKQYTLYFPNHKQGVYTMRFDRTTSQPIIISPAPPVAPATQQELDAAAKQNAVDTSYQSLSSFQGISLYEGLTIIAGVVGGAILLLCLLLFMIAMVADRFLRNHEEGGTKPLNEEEGQVPILFKIMAVLLPLAGVSLVATCIAMNVNNPRQQELDRVLAANLQQKYGMTLISHQCPQVLTQGTKGGTYMDTMTFDTCFSQPTSYQLQKDGKMGTYMVSWDIQSGEPYATVTTTVPVTPINQPTAPGSK